MKRHLTSIKFIGTALALVFGSCVAEINSDKEELAPKNQASLVETVAQRSCAAEDVLAAKMEEDPTIADTMYEIEEHTQRIIQSRSLSGTTIIIPTVVHVVYRTASENVSDAQIQSQIDVLNKDFRRTNTDANNLWAQATDANIEFRLMGVSRTSTTKNGFGTNDSIKFTAQGGRDVYQPGQYLNIWLGNVGGGILGYAQFPGGAASTDGVVIDYRYFGTMGTATAPFNLGRTATHEVGHWLNLRHIWGDSATCGVDDQVSDTPDSNQPNYGCAAHVSCNNGGDMIQNYMDYSDDSCMNLFTVGQKSRMQALFASGGARESLKNAPLTPVNFGGGTTPPPSTTYQVIDTRTALTASTNAQTPYGPYNATGRTAIKFELSGGTGDADMYVRFGSAPTTSTYDCRPYVTGNTETCEFNPSQAGNYYVMIHAYSAYSNVTLKVSAAGGSTTPTTETSCTDAIDNDQDGATDCSDSDCSANSACQVTPPPSGYQTIDTRSNQSAAKNVKTQYGPYSSVGFTKMKFEISGGTGDADMYVRFGSAPTTSTYNCRPYVNGNAEVCEFNPSQSGSYYVMINAYAAYSGVTLTVKGFVGTGTSSGSAFIASSNFDSGLDDFATGGSNAQRVTNNSNCFSGGACIELRGAAGDASSIALNDVVDLSEFSQIQIDFNFRAVNFTANETFSVEIWNGATWIPAGVYSAGTHFNNNVTYNASVPVDSSAVIFSPEASIRIRSASGNDHRVYVDNVNVTAQ